MERLNFYDIKICKNSTNLESNPFDKIIEENPDLDLITSKNDISRCLKLPNDSQMCGNYFVMTGDLKAESLEESLSILQNIIKDLAPGYITITEHPIAEGASQKLKITKSSIGLMKLKPYKHTVYEIDSEEFKKIYNMFYK